MSIAEKLQAVAKNQQKVYDAGFTAGQAAGGDTDAAFQEGFDAGKQAEYDTFWDTIQQNGNRTDYQFAFTGWSWTPENFKPKYDIKPVRADYMFANLDASCIRDLTETLESAGVVLDTAQCINFTNFARYGSPQRFPALDTRSAESLNNMFVNCSVATIDKLIFKDDGSQVVLSMFSACSPLVDINEIEGVIGQNMNLAPSKKVSKLTITNVISALSSTTSGMTLQLSKIAVNAAFTTDEWNALAATKSNWTITLA